MPACPSRQLGLTRYGLLLRRSKNSERAEVGRGRNGDIYLSTAALH